MAKKTKKVKPVEPKIKEIKEETRETSELESDIKKAETERLGETIAPKVKIIPIIPENKEANVQSQNQQAQANTQTQNRITEQTRGIVPLYESARPNAQNPEATRQAYKINFLEERTTLSPPLESARPQDLQFDRTSQLGESPELNRLRGDNRDEKYQESMPKKSDPHAKSRKPWEV